MTTLAPMGTERFEAFMEVAIAGYADDNVASGRWSREDAMTLSKAEFARLLPDGVKTKDNGLYVIEDESARDVGFVWFGYLMRGKSKVAFVYQLEIYPEFRRLGHASRAMKSVEAIALDAGAASMGLHVFAKDEAAQALYASLGYRTTSINMSKPVKQPMEATL